MTFSALCSSLSNMQQCACGNLRKTARAITQFYDRYFQPIDLRSTQVAVLLTISLRGSISVGELADILLMDQTTVTRNTEILRKRGYIAIKKEVDDARRKSISLTESGEKKLAEAVPLWEQAQSRIENGLGVERFQEFLKILKEIDELVK